MRGFKLAFFLFILLGSVLLATVFYKARVQPPFSRSFSPLLQELGKPIKSVDRAKGI